VLCSKYDQEGVEKMTRQFVTFLLLGWCVANICTLSLAQQSQKSLTNEKVLKMVREKLPESVIVSAIQSGPFLANIWRLGGKN